MWLVPLAVQSEIKTILRYLRPPEPSPATLWWTFSAILAMVFFFLTFEVISRRLHRIRTMRSSRNGFDQLTLVCQLSAEEIKQLRRLVEEGHIRFPDRLFTSFEFFNDLLDEIGPPGSGSLSESEIQTLRIIRNKIFFGERMKLPPVKSTRELKANQWLHLRRTDGKVFMTPVIEAGSSGLLVATPLVHGKYVEMVKGEHLDIYFWRDRDASYEFESEVLGQSGGRLLITILKHVDDIARIQRRQYHRVNTSIRVTIVPVPRDELEAPERKSLRTNQQAYSGYVINLSGSGLALTARFSLKPSDLIFVELPTDEENNLPVMAKILAVNRREATDEYIMNAEFVGMSADNTEKIFRLIYSQGRQKAPAT